MEGYCSTGQSPQRAVVPIEEEEDKKKEQEVKVHIMLCTNYKMCKL
jgi:hypothetical protein